MSSTLAAVAADLALRHADLAPQRRGDAAILDVTHDSRDVTRGALFCAAPGATTDGHDHAPRALAAGASALLVERWLDVDAPQLLVASVRRAMGPVAAVVHGHPSERLTIVGVTGTNGKTTTTYLLEAAFGAAGVGTGVVGTTGIRIHGEVQLTPRAVDARLTSHAGRGVGTTPEAPDLHRILEHMHVRGVDAVAMEVSSHGLDQHRVDGVRFGVVVFTNLTQDHLDYHGSFEAYFAAKARLFNEEFANAAVICVDDPWGERLAAATQLAHVTYGYDARADERVADVRTTLSGTTCRLTGAGDVTLRTRLLGDHNALNAAGAYLAATRAGVAPEDAVAGIAECEGVPGRFQPVVSGQPFAVLVDYAHTPDALERVVAAARRLADGHRVHIVVGCGGERDRGKRPMMGAIAAGADRAVLTSDNPRSEDPATILDEMWAGAQTVAGADVTVEGDRRTAIRLALSGAASGDVVLIAGKGHETTQDLGGRVVAFDDHVIALEELRALGYATPADDRAHVARQRRDGTPP